MTSDAVTRNMELFHMVMWLTVIWVSIETREPPKVQPFFLPNNPDLCDEINAMCTAKSTSHTELEWLKDDVRIGGDSLLHLPNTTISNVGTVLFLSIKCVSITHIGNYSCSARNSFGKDKFTAPLIITVSPFWIEESLPSKSTVHANEGETIELLCPATGNPKPNITWYRGG